MLTEVDIERIMQEKRRFFEEVAHSEGYGLDCEELYDVMEIELPVSETNGLM